MSDTAENEEVRRGPTVDPQVPEPRGLSTYIQVLGEWTKGMVSEPFLLGLIQSQGFGEAERNEFLAGADQLWGLVPPVEAPDVAEAELEPAAARSLALALVLRGEHALHHHLPDAPPPRELRTVAELITVIHLILEGHDAPGSPASKRLRGLQKRLARRNVDTSRLADRKEDVRDAVLARRRAEDDAERAVEEQVRQEEAALEKRRTRRVRRTELPIRGLLGTLGSLALAVFLFNTLTPKPSGGLPSAADYSEVPVIGIIRHPDVVYIRVKPEWLTLGEPERKVGGQRLFDRLSKESGGAVAKIVFQTTTGTDLAIVTAQSVKWRGPLESIVLPKEAPKLKEETGQSQTSRDP